MEHILEATLESKLILVGPVLQCEISTTVSRALEWYSQSLHYLLLNDKGEPESFYEAMSVDDFVKWEQAMDAKMESL